MVPFTFYVNLLILLIGFQHRTVRLASHRKLRDEIELIQTLRKRTKQDGFRIFSEYWWKNHIQTNLQPLDGLRQSFGWRVIIGYRNGRGSLAFWTIYIFLLVVEISDLVYSSRLTSDRMDETSHRFRSIWGPVKYKVKPRYFVIQHQKLI